MNMKNKLIEKTMSTIVIIILIGLSGYFFFSPTAPTRPKTIHCTIADYLGVESPENWRYTSKKEAVIANVYLDDLPRMAQDAIFEKMSYKYVGPGMISNAHYVTHGNLYLVNHSIDQKGEKRFSVFRGDLSDLNTGLASIRMQKSFSKKKFVAERIMTRLGILTMGLKENGVFLNNIIDIAERGF